jgi:hypothetical protein
MTAKMRNASFLANESSSVVRTSSENIDLERELKKRGFDIASHGRIDWDRLSNINRYQVSDDCAASKTIIKIIEKHALTGIAIVVWSDAGINPILIDASNISEYALRICEEDWDCWIISEKGSWVIEKYHEGEVCFSDNELSGL